MTQYLVCIASLIVPAILIAKKRSFLIACSLPLLSMLSTGIIVHSLYFFGMNWNANLVGNFYVISLITSAVLAMRIKKVDGDKHLLHQVVAIGVPAVGILVLTVLSRLLAKHQSDGLLTSIDFIILEDNAKWTNITSLITQGKSLPVGGVGGVLITYLVLCGSFVKTLFPFFNLNDGEISLALSTVVCGQLGLIVMAPLALLPLTKLLNKGRNAWKGVPGFWLASLIIAGGSAAFQSLGQLSSQLVFVVGAYSIGIFLSFRSSSEDGEPILFLGLFCLTATTSIWLPYQLLTALIPVIALGFFVYRRTRKVRQKLDYLTLLLLVLTVTAIPIAIDTFKYITVTDTNFQNLLTAGGATNIATPVLLLIPIFLVFLILTLREKSDEKEIEINGQNIGNESYLVLFFVALVTISVIFVDYLRTGSAHYGSQKVQYMCALLLVVTLIPIAVTNISKHKSVFDGFVLSCTCSMLLLFALSSDATFSSLTQKFRSQQWSEIATRPREVNWQAWITDLAKNKAKLEDVPVACGLIIVNERYWNVSSETYLCTRHLHALAGLESTAGPLVEWQLRMDWLKSIDYLRALPNDVKSRDILVLSESEVVGTARLDSYFATKQS